MRNCRTGLYALVLLIAAVGCASSAAKAFVAGQQAEAAGDLDTAYERYLEATRGAPSEKTYADAHARTRDTYVKELSNRAQAQEKEKAWDVAAKTWGRASEVAPDVEDYAVRRDLSSLKAKDLDAYGWYQGVDAIKKAHPEHPIVARTHERAKERALADLVAVAEKKLEAGEPAPAVEKLEAALEIDKPKVDAELVKRARAALFVQRGDERMNANDPFGAYENYEKAQGLKPAPQIAQKLRTARRRAAPIVKRLDRAYALTSRGRYARALALYREVAEMDGAPATVDKEIEEVRKALIAAECKKATAEGAKGRFSSARRALHRALDASTISETKKAEAKTAATELSKGALVAAMGRLQRAELPSGPIRSALEKVAMAAIERTVKRAEAVAKRDPARAMQMIAGLEPYADSLPQITKLGRSLKVGAFSSTLDEAIRSADRGDMAKAARLLRTALEMSEAPKKLATPIEEGCQKLGEKRFAEAQSRFEAALVVAPGSKLATTGIAISKKRADAASNAAVKSLKRGNDEAALAVLERLAAKNAKHPNVAAGATALIARAQRDAKRGDDAAATDALVMAARLTPLDPGTRTTLDQGLEAFGQGDHDVAKTRFASVVAAASSAAVAKAALEIADKRVMEARSEAEQAAAKLSDLIARAKTDAEKGNMSGARRALQAALEADPSAKPHAKKLDAAIKRVTRGDASEGLQAIETSGLPKSSSLMPALVAYATAMAGTLVARAERTAKKRPAEAIAILEKLGPFEKRLPKIVELKKSIRNAAFVAQLDAADRHANAGRIADAAKVLAAALEQSTAPPKLRTPAAKAIDALAAEKYLDAERSFGTALAAAKKSKLAERGQAIAQRLRTAQEEAALAAIEQEKDLDASVTLLEAAVGYEPKNERAAAGAQWFLTTAASRADAADDEAIAKLIGYATRLAPERAAAADLKAGVNSLAAHDHASAERAFSSARAKAPASRAAMLGHQVAKTRLLASIETGKIDVRKLDTKTAQILATLKKDEPDRPEPTAALAELLEGARGFAETDTKEAARLLSLAIIVAAPATALKTDLERGRKALAKDDPVGAAKAFAAAKKKAPDDELVATGTAIAERARVTRLVNALAAGKDKRAHDALKRRLAEDGEKITKEIVAAAEREADAGKEPRAARLLDALNRHTKEAEARKATQAGNKLLAKRDYVGAEAAYEKAQRFGTSIAAKSGASIAFNRRVALMFQQVSLLTNLEDLEKGAVATKELLSIDPYDKDGLKALDAALDHADKKAKAGDDKTMIRALRAAATAVDATSELGEGIDHLAAGKNAEARGVFARLEKELVPEEGETDGSLKKLLSLQRKVAARGRAIASGR